MVGPARNPAAPKRAASKRAALNPWTRAAPGDRRAPRRPRATRPDRARARRRRRTAATTRHAGTRYFSDRKKRSMIATDPCSPALPKRGFTLSCRHQARGRSLSGEAEGQIEKIDAWWRANRLAAPDLFTSELEQGLADLGASPSLGTIYDAGAQTVRRLLLPRSHDHLYFVHEPERIYVVAVWSAFRGRGPKL